MTFDYSCSKPYKDLPLWLTKIYQTTKNQEFSLFDWLNQSDWTSWQEGKKLAVWSSLVDIACTPMLSYIFQSADYDQVSFNASSTSLVFAEWPCTHIWYWAFALKYSFPISFFDLSWSRTHFHRNEVPRLHHEFCERHAEEICKRVTFLYACIPFLFTYCGITLSAISQKNLVIGAFTVNMSIGETCKWPGRIVRRRARCLL